jgi:hypothetical protein
LLDSSAKAIVLGLMLSGIGMLLTGVFATLAWRRPDVSLSNILRSGSDISARPERYVRPERVRTIRILHLVGALFFACGVMAGVGHSLRVWLRDANIGWRGELTEPETPPGRRTAARESDSIERAGSRSTMYGATRPKVPARIASTHFSMLRVAAMGGETT